VTAKLAGCIPPWRFLTRFWISSLPAAFFPSGPLLRASAYTWLGVESNESAPIHSGSVTNLTCPYDLPTLQEAD
jgi:hypothetical protein